MSGNKSITNYADFNNYHYFGIKSDNNDIKLIKKSYNFIHILILMLFIVLIMFILHIFQ